MTNGEWFMATTTQPLEVKRNGTCIWLYFNNEENHYMLPTEWWDAEQTEPRFDKDINVRSKDEPNSSEKPNNCETCRFELYCPEMCEGCCEWDSHYEPKTEPQTEDEVLREQCRAFMGIVEQMKRSE